MKFAESSELFGNEKDDSFKGSIGVVSQSFGGEDLYPMLEEKAANLHKDKTTACGIAFAAGGFT